MILKRWTDGRINAILWRLKNLPAHLRYEWAKDKAAVKALMPAILGGRLGCEGSLGVRVIRANGTVEDYGIVSRRVITRNGVDLVVKDFGGVAGNDVGDFNFHGLGSGVAAEASTDAALGAEFTTQLNPDNTRATGVKSNPASSGDSFFYRTVGTSIFDAAVAVTEHGLFNQAATGGGVLFDRSVFSVINLSSGDGFQSTYTLTMTAGG